jgi:hypothetical protein
MFDELKELLFGYSPIRLSKDPSKNKLLEDTLVRTLPPIYESQCTKSNHDYSSFLVCGNIRKTFLKAIIATTEKEGNITEYRSEVYKETIKNYIQRLHELNKSSILDMLDDSDKIREKLDQALTHDFCKMIYSSPR